MRNYDIRNKYFNNLLNNPNLKWMGQNTNHIPSHSYIIDEMVKSIKDEEFHAYAPPLGLEELRERTIEHIGLHDKTAMISDGAVSGLFNICKLLCSNGNELITTDPTWIWPVHFTNSAGSNVTQIPIYGSEYNFTLQADRLKNNLHSKTGILYLVDPNNPLGTVISEQEALKIAEICEANDIIIIHDCTYRDFADNHTLISKYYPEKTITIWSFSKWLGMAGMRVGAVVASESMMEEIAKYPPNILGSNLVSQRGAIAGLKIKNEWFPEVNRIQKNNQKMIFDKISSIEELSMPIYPSQSNFIILEVNDPNLTPESLSYVFSNKGILIRQGSYHTKTFGHKFIKVSLTVPEDWVTEFIELLPDSIIEAKKIKNVPKLF